MSHPERLQTFTKPLFTGLLAPAALAPFFGGFVDRLARRADPQNHLEEQASRVAARRAAGAV